jgi:poly(hydroxyalkanoate) granule-associated protein
MTSSKSASGKTKTSKAPKAEGARKNTSTAEQTLQRLSQLGIELPAPLRDKAQAIWAAGLAAFANAQKEGGKVGKLFETLVKEGQNIQQRTQDLAQSRMMQAQEHVTDMAKGLTASAAGQWDKLEGIFEERVAKALEKLGVPTAKDTAELLARMEELNQLVIKLTLAMGKPAPAPSKKNSAKTVATKKLASVPKAAPAKTTKASAGKASAKKPAAKKTA